jgi:hypothetical protein
MNQSRTSLITTAMLSGLITGPIAYAASVHLRAHDVPALLDEGLTASVSAGLAGLRADDVLVTLRATGAPRSGCPGAHAELTFVTHELIAAAAIVNGAVSFTVRTDPPIAGVVCEHERVVDIEFIDAFLEVRQPPEARDPLLKAYCDLSGCTPIGS